MLEPGRAYTNAYFLKVDAAGHSSIVASNPDDLVTKLFDSVESQVYGVVEEARKLNDCAYAKFWGWQGDGGLCVFHDTKDSRAMKAAIISALRIVDRALPVLRENLAALGVKGELNIRVAAHRGSFTTALVGDSGSIHSRDVNFVAHLETVAPSNTVAVSREVMEKLPAEYGSKFTEMDFPFEGKPVFVYESAFHNGSTRIDWTDRVSVEDSTKVALLERRPSEDDKARIISCASSEIVDLGTSLNTCSEYLISQRRPAAYQDAVRELLKRGVHYKCLILDPESEIAVEYGALRGEDLVKKSRASIERLEEFAGGLKTGSELFEVHAYSDRPCFAAITVDCRLDHGLMIFAPYLPSGAMAEVKRADSPHIIAKAARVPTLADQVTQYMDALLAADTTRRLI